MVNTQRFENEHLDVPEVQYWHEERVAGVIQFQILLRADYRPVCSIWAPFNSEIRGEGAGGSGNELYDIDRENILEIHGKVFNEGGFVRLVPPGAFFSEDVLH